MTSTTSPQTPPAPPSAPPSAPDRTAPSRWQGSGGDGADAGQLWDWAYARRGLRLRTLVLLRWALIAGELGLVLWVQFGLGLDLPLVWCLAAILASAWVNLSMTLAWPGSRLAGRREAVVQLGFDLMQMAALMGLTGGIENPFLLLLIAPVAVGAATLTAKDALALVLLSMVIVVLLAFYSAPLPWPAGERFSLPPLYRMGLLGAELIGIMFTAAYAWQASAEASRMELALAATQGVLAREQRLSALGGLAAAAAHELGTPLATIQVVAKEMARGLPPGTPFHEDVTLLVTQAERCREILRKLSQAPETGDVHHSRMSLSQLLDEVSDPHGNEDVLINTDVTCAPGAPILEVRRMPEVVHGLAAFVENAADFAESSVEVTAYYDEDKLIIDVRDDGPGFSAEVIARLGEPYVTTRSQGEGSRTHHHGMGLGFFIAKTLLERTGAQVEFRNAKGGGALVSARWRRERIEAAAGDLNAP
jgi:two-component system, sensor histidine kinase RegB